MSKSFLILLVLVIFLGAGFGGSFVGGIIYGQSLDDDTENELSPRLGAAGQIPGGGQGAGQRGQGRRGQGGGPASAQAVEGETSAVENSGPGDSPQGSRLELPERTGATGESQTGRSPGGERRNRADENETSLSETTDGTGDAAEEAGEPGLMTGAPTGDTRTETGGRPSGGRGGLSGTLLALEGNILTVESPRGELPVTLSETTSVYQLVVASRDTLAGGATVRINGSRDSEGSLVAQAVIVLPEGAEGLFGMEGSGGRRRGGGS